MNDYIGIDLGTTNSIVSYMNNGKYETIKIGKCDVVPSAIFFDSKDKLFFGYDALKRIENYPQSGITMFKRMLKDPTEVRKIKYKKIKETEEHLIEKVYLIDTNIFIKSPSILDRLKENEKAILSYTVIDELKFRTGYSNSKYQAQYAIENILKYQENNSTKIEFVESDLGVIKNGLFDDPRTDNDLNDNKILSIAIIKKNEGVNVNLITNDNALRAKANACGIENINLEDFETTNKIIEREENEFIEISGKSASTLLLQYLRVEASKKIGIDVKKAVITVPANFNQVEVELTKNAGFDAGFEEVKVLKEPIAAAIVYGLDSDIDKNILVYDFGGGTFDVSILNVKKDGSMEVLSTGGDSKLGGEDITNSIAEYIYENLEDDYNLAMYSLEESNLEESQYYYNSQKIREKAEQLKIALSEFENQTISLNNIYLSKEEQTTISYEISREEIENQVLRSINGKVTQIVRNTIENAGLKVDDIDILALAGGTSLIPLLQQGVSMILGIQPKSDKGLATIVSNGAAIKAEQLWSPGSIGPESIDKTVHSFGVRLHDYTFDELISIGEQLPTKATKRYKPVNKDQDSINIEAFTKDVSSIAIKTFGEGIEFLDNILISGIPEELDSRDLIIEITFNLNEEYILSLDARLLDKHGIELKSESLKITRRSKSILFKNNKDN